MAELQILGCRSCPWWRQAGKLLCTHPHRKPDEGVVIRALLEGCPLREEPTVLRLVAATAPPPVSQDHPDQVDPTKALRRLLSTTDRCTLVGESWVLWSLDGPRQRAVGCMTMRQVDALSKARLVTVDGEVLRAGSAAHDLQHQGDGKLLAAVRRALGVRR